MASTQDSWSNIPVEIAGLFLGRLHAHVDRVRFTAVCPQWHSAAQQVRLPPPLPLLALKDRDTFYSMPRGEPLHFAGCKNGFATAFGKWLVYLGFRKLLLVDLFSGATMTLPAPPRVYLPGEDGCVGCTRDRDDCACKVYDTDDFEQHGSTLHSRVHLTYKDVVGDSRDGHDSTEDGDNLEGGYDSVDEGDYYNYLYSDDSELIEDLKTFQVIKLMEFSPNIFVALFQGSIFNKIAVCRPGSSKWSVAWGLPLGIADMAFYEGKLYVVDYCEDLWAMDISVDEKTGDPRISFIEEVIKGKRSNNNDQTLLRMVYLVESCGSLLLVRRMVSNKHVNGEGQIHTFPRQCEPDVFIFEADFERSQWVEVTNLADDQALFLGPCSRAICLPQGDSPSNCVWFLDDYKDFHFWDEEDNNLSSSTSSVANHKPFSPLPAISWKGYQGNSCAAWLFPAN